MTPDSPVTAIKGVGEEAARRLARLNIRSVSDLIHNYPRRYDDYSQLQQITSIKPGMVTIRGKVRSVQGSYRRRGLHITEAIASDTSGSVRLVWFNQPYRAASLNVSTEYYISGEFGLHSTRLSITNPSIEQVSAFPVNTARIVPVYKETKGLKSYQIRKFIRQIVPTIDQLSPSLPDWLIREYKLISSAEALRNIHFPASKQDLASAKERLGFEEVFCLTLAALLNKYEIATEQTLAVTFDKDRAKRFVASLPFELTDAQRRAVWQIYQDMQKKQPMNRLLEGDVGSGKTVVAVMSAVMVLAAKLQVALMAPTEILAKQHADTIYKLLKPLGLEKTLGVLVGSLTPARKRAVKTAIKEGNVEFIVGTHALIQEGVDMHNLGLVIVDEQHRFGVDQRNALQAKAGHLPHLLSLTATPIPRSLALTLYGELDISIINIKPAGRKHIATKICSPNSRTQLYAAVDKELTAGRQMFVVCPLITESDLLPVKSARQQYQDLSTGPFKHRRVELLHGKMKADDKQEVMQRFVNGDIDILVATTVIEVGVDVPNATVMLIENAERFGLAQIHQLRGRVGRSTHQGYCYLMLGDSTTPPRRLRALESSNNGFELAELDLKIRGPGAIYGTQQHGQLDLRIAQLTDTLLIAKSRQAAQEFIERKESLSGFPDLSRRVEALRTVINLD